VKINGLNPGYSIMLAAINVDSAQSIVSTNAVTGAFSFPVTNKIFNYQIVNRSFVPFQTPPNVVAHPGQTGVIVNFQTTAVERSSNLLPDEWTLAQNYPNPFNPSTVISYQLASVSRVRLVVYNALGQVVGDLVSGEQGAGWNQVVWKANVPSGLYFYRLDAVSTSDPAKRFESVKKMLLLK
jgi:hypothetical protein